ANLAAHVDDNPVERRRLGGLALVLAILFLFAFDTVERFLERLRRSLADRRPHVHVADAAAVAFEHARTGGGGIAKSLERRKRDDFDLELLWRGLGGASKPDLYLVADLAAEGADRMVGGMIDAQDFVADLQAGALGGRAFEHSVDKIAPIEAC